MPEPVPAHDDPSEVADLIPATVGFADLGLGPELLTALDRLGHVEPTPIQRETIPHLLDGSDVLGQAATGTGKTGAFCLPILERIRPDHRAGPAALVLVPTRELAIQVADACTAYAQGRKIRVVAVYGGQPIPIQLQALKRGAQVVVGTPGRVIDLIKRKALPLDDLRTVVLDEADEMLDMGFAEDIEVIVQATPTTRQTVLFSATMPPRIDAIARRYQNEPVRIRTGQGSAAPSNTLVRQSVYYVHRAHKAAALGRILDIETPNSALVFCRTRSDVDDLAETLNGRGYRAEALHGGMDQLQRDRVMGRLRDGTAQLLVATDVAARGLDVDSLTHVVNYDVPAAPESYVHRIGRVGRAGREGVAITLSEPRQRRLVSNIEHLTKQKIEVGRVPTVDELRERQIGATTDAIRAALTDDDLDPYNRVLHGLAGDDNVRSIALAAIKLLHLTRHPATEEADIPDARRESRSNRDGRPNRDRGRKPFDGPGSRARKAGPKGKGRHLEARPGTGFVMVNLGRTAGIRPGDLVGAIANETSLSGREIGPIRVEDKFSVVGVPESSVDKVVSAIAATTIRGRKARTRRYVE